LKTEPWGTDAAKKPKQSVVLLVGVIKKTLKRGNKKGALLKPNNWHLSSQKYLLWAIIKHATLETRRMSKMPPVLFTSRKL